MNTSTRYRGRRRTPLLTAVVGVVAVVVSSCASISVNALPQPGPAYRGGYDLVFQFENVLNLPDRAQVVMDGKAVGVITKVSVANDHVDVTSRVGADAVVPANIHASLQQATVLGDIYVALDRPPPDQPEGPPLAPGATVPLAQTSSPPQLEDTIANLANFVSSGSIQRMQNTIIGINRVTPTGDAAHKIASQVAADLSDLNAGLDNVDQWFNGVAQTGQVLHDRLPTFEEFFSPKGMAGFDRTTYTANYVSTLLPGVGSVYAGGFWLVPLLKSLGDAVGAMAHDKQAFEAEVPAWRRLFYEDFLPQDKHPAINITSIIGPDGRELSGNVQDVLRILGATP